MSDLTPEQRGQLWAYIVRSLKAEEATRAGNAGTIEGQAEFLLGWLENADPDIAALLATATPGDGLREALDLLLGDIRSVRPDEPPERMIPTQHRVQDIRQAYAALSEGAEREPLCPACGHTAHELSFDCPYAGLIPCSCRYSGCAATPGDGLDVERLARVLTTVDPDTGQDDWQLIHVSQADDYAKSRREWAQAIAAEYARLAATEQGERTHD